MIEKIKAFFCKYYFVSLPKSVYITSVLCSCLSAGYKLSESWCAGDDACSFLPFCRAHDGMFIKTSTELSKDIDHHDLPTYGNPGCVAFALPRVILRQSVLSLARFSEVARDDLVSPGIWSFNRRGGGGGGCHVSLVVSKS